ncbi:uncharacterized protein LOC113238855 [Hyposmocoma kahamanoa]|uniref:uncharacterized protein LOC113238855 n=1 Tax=Hyposmocoma kahamanoa TaxID=1477025 RepID=UPI000E6D9C22|nr:uncharacterized protein LOC113238855 [Hyposmocoma kahamanoa]
MKKDGTLTVKVFIQFYNKNLYTFWCERVDNDTKSNSIVLEANLTNVEDRTLSQFFAAATIPVPSLDGEFDCFLRGDAFPYNDTRRNMLIDPSDVNRPCHARVNFINTSFKHTSKPASTEVDASRWIYVGVGVGLVILCVGVAAIFLYRRKWRRNITVSGTQVN